jgi:hypothetical protein
MTVQVRQRDDIILMLDNAHLNVKTVRNLILTTFVTASIGPNPIHIGSSPVSAIATILAQGFRFLDFTWFSLHTTTAAAPSLIPEALPAVTVPF